MKKEKFTQENWRRASLFLKQALETEKGMLILAKEGYAKKEKVQLEGRLRINKNRGTYSYFVVSKNTKKHGEIIKKENMDTAKKYAQKMYDDKMEKSVLKELALIEELEKELTILKQNDYLKRLHPARRALIRVMCQEGWRYEETWAKKDFVQLNWKTEEKVFVTKGGVAVRSKSEKMIGELLEEAGIQYRYEAQLKIGKNVFYPDFTILDPLSHEEIIWEHFGLMKDEEYRRNAYEKIEAYTNAGFLKNRFYMTFEDENHKFNQKTAEELVAGLRRKE